MNGPRTTADDPFIGGGFHWEGGFHWGSGWGRERGQREGGEGKGRRKGGKRERQRKNTMSWLPSELPWLRWT